MNKKIINFAKYKIIRFIILMVAVAIFSFILLDLSPIDPVNAYLNNAPVSAAQRAMLESYWGVGVPLTDKIFPVKLCPIWSLSAPSESLAETSDPHVFVADYPCPW